ncbi:MAG: copper chaperone PCu(A)C, partial [Thermomicrobiales bacterium]
MNETPKTTVMLNRRTLIAASGALIAAQAAARLFAASAQEATPVASPAAAGTMDISGMGAVFMTIANAGAEADRLLGGTSTAATAVGVHEMADDDGTMIMRPLADGLEIPADGSVELKPGSYHIMLLGLTSELTPGDTLDVTLTFEKAGDIAIEVPVIRQKQVETMVSAPVVAGDITIDKIWSR